MSIEHHALPYLNRGEGLVSRLQHLPWLAWLEGGHPASGFGRYEVLVGEPVMTLISRGGQAECCIDGRTQPIGDPLAFLQETLRQRRVDAQELPFCGGALGYFGYDLGHRLAGLADERDASALPEMAVGIYDWAIVTDHLHRQTQWVGRRSARGVLPSLRERLQAPEPPPGGADIATPPLEEPGREGYLEAFARVQAYLRAGDCYQVNLARRLSVPFTGDAWAIYQRLRALSPVPFGAYLSMPFGQVLSLSPERFLSLRASQVETRPIKGTRPRRADPVADQREREDLRTSAKDRAENVMIVDLLRNDLGRVCRPGTIRVTELCEVESYPNVHHLVSSVRGELAAGRDAIDLLGACLPGGSITGAPKRRAMQIIAELEPHRRGVYCGAIGYISDDGSMDTNVAIRTVQCGDGQLSYWTGGGLVVDSEAEAEFQETLHKAAPFLALLEGR